MEGYKVTVEGQYLVFASGDSKRKELRRYLIEVNVKKMEGALSVIKNKLLEPALRKKYSDYVSFRSHSITEIVPLSKANANITPTLDTMGSEAMKQYIEDKDLPIRVDLYSDLPSLKKAIQDCEADEDSFLVTQDLLEDRVAEDNDLAELNPDVLEQPIKLGKPLKESPRKPRSRSIEILSSDEELEEEL